MNKLAIALSLLTILISGCATTMTPEQEEHFAIKHSLTQICLARGQLDPNLAAQARNLQSSSLRGYTFNEANINKHVSEVYKAQHEISPEHCRQFAARLHSDVIEAQIEARNAEIERQQLAQSFRSAMNSISQGYSKLNKLIA
ncbi:MAG: hypothetical protein Q4G13_02150 [Moraxella sp.]|nr:hypothetical protein [Moraxella sp.]